MTGGRVVASSRASMFKLIKRARLPTQQQTTSNSRVVPSTILHRCESRNPTHCSSLSRQFTHINTHIHGSPTTPESAITYTATHFSPAQHFVEAEQYVGHHGQRGLSSASLADIDAVKAAATARTKEKCILCEDVIWDQINLTGTVGRPPAFTS
ncbi:uncharacterized protein EDB91DRAFT_242765 [Suillus paluster]|uniref:uncharacterized protein n=1 Tax=Suillus paluster TaxID=48578 RepID=UPI001B85C956|nr:uncharacterized protein EDB91DRAFT_242765 [Suillus paluster]KAG1743337.1 hypothetical protein EDB91DRAFT_242765 [Suillus paluster]